MTEIEKQNAMPQVGDIWQEVDPRHPRFVRVDRLTVDLQKVRIITVSLSGGEWHARIGARETFAKIERFNGKRSGYKLHQRATSE